MAENLSAITKWQQVSGQLPGRVRSRRCGTAFFCVALACGVNHGVLDRGTYLDSARRAWSALAAAHDDDNQLRR